MAPKTPIFFEIPRPLCLKGLHLSLSPLPSGKGQTENFERPSFSGFWYRSQAFAPSGFAMGFLSDGRQRKDIQAAFKAVFGNCFSV